MKIKWPQIIIGLITVVVLAILLRLNRNEDIQEHVSIGDIHNLYHDSIRSTINVVDYAGRSEHILLDDNREYFYEIIHVSGRKIDRGILSDCTQSGDSIFKEPNSNLFVVHTDGNRILTVKFR
jgi:tRNA A22 N-methylase